MVAIFRERVPWSGQLPLGRNKHFDSRSVAYPVRRVDQPQSMAWARRVGIFNQGDLGSCTGNSMAGVLGTEPFNDLVRDAFPHITIGEDLAVHIYDAAEQLDGGAGLPTEDNGSSGLSVAKVAKTAKYISGYTNGSSVDDIIHGLQSGPGMIGINWYNTFDLVGPDGVAPEPAAGAYVRGGHELEIARLDMVNELVWCPNSWGPTWGRRGWVAFRFDTLDRLMREDGDTTFPVPLDVPAPVPAADPLTTLVAATRDWLAARHSGLNKDAADAVRSFLVEEGAL